MDSSTLISQIQDCLRELPEIREEKQAIGSAKVKAWKTEVEHVLKLGGKNTAKLLQNFQGLKFGASAMGSESVSSSSVKFHAYQAELDAAEKLLKNAIQTIQIFGVSEEKKLPEWFKPEAKSTGKIHIGEREVDIHTITLNEFLIAFVSLSESDKSLDESLKTEVRERITAIRKNSLLQPFLNQTLDRLFSKL
jgi:hypothetical protein